MNNSNLTPFRKASRTLVLFFVMINTMAIVFRKRLEDKNIDVDVVIVGNIILFGVSMLSLWMYSKAGSNKKSHGMVRNVYGGFMFKFFALIVAAMVYFFFAKEINKAAIFICLGLYLVYNFAGVLQLVKQQPNSDASQHHQKPHTKEHHPHHHK